MDVQRAYVELLKSAITNELYKEFEFKPLKRNNPLRRSLLNIARSNGLRLTLAAVMSDDERESGKIVAPMAHTMVGRKRLDNLDRCIQQLLQDAVPGDLVETGVWKGGAVIFMRGVLNAYGAEDRKVWACDSFEGLPVPDAKYAKDAGAQWHTRDELAISLEEVQENFRRYGLLQGVEFLKGWFADTLPNAPIEQIALARLDGDMYGSTMDALTHLYDKVSPGGYLVIDDYNGVQACKAAVDDFRKERSITEPIEGIDWTGVFWRKSS